MVTRLILEHTRRDGDLLAAIKTQLIRIEAKLDGIDLGDSAGKLDGLHSKIDGLDNKADALTKNLPSIVGDVMREVLRERDGKV
jgi:hypothetical protein